MCAVLDSSVLWLRHNLRKKFEVNCYMQVPIPPSASFPPIFADFLAFLFQSMRENMSPSDLILAEAWDPTRYARPPAALFRPGVMFAPPEYHWVEFWRAVLGLLEFLTKKIDELQSTVGIRLLIKEVSTLPRRLASHLKFRRHYLYWTYQSQPPRLSCPTPRLYTSS
jgi:hypothetical protein